jgi:hypothetical protein
MEYQASTYSDRKELDRVLASRVVEEDDTLVGTATELSLLSLKAGKTVYGVPVLEV